MLDARLWSAALAVVALSIVRPSLAVAQEAGAAAVADPATATIIAAEDALEHIGDEVVVEFVVKGGRKLDDKEICFLNSNRDHRDSGTFTAVIFRTGLARYASDGIADPATEFQGKTIRVSGVVEERNGQAQIVVASPTQIELVADDEPVSPEPVGR
jgi:DNA/RNA endonuclease YhcR with UshA esterase domain